MQYLAAVTILVLLISGCASNSNLDEHGPSSNQVLIEKPVVDPVGVMLQDGYLAEQRSDYSSAEALYISAAQQGNAQAHYELARLYAKGSVGGVPDLKKCNDHLVMAMSLGHAEGTRVLAWQYMRGAGVEKNVEKAKALFAKSAEKSVRAQRELGMLYINAYTSYPLNDIQMGMNYLRKATAKNDAESAYYLYLAITKSGNPNQESDDAILVAVKQEYPKALYHFAKTAMDKGRYEQAAQIYLKAALLGDTNSMFEYANNLILDRFKVQNKELEAYTWFAIAAERRHPQAIKEMTALHGIRTMYDKNQPGRLDAFIVNTKKLINPWQPKIN